MHVQGRLDRKCTYSLFLAHVYSGTSECYFSAMTSTHPGATQNRAATLLPHLNRPRLLGTFCNRTRVSRLLVPCVQVWAGTAAVPDWFSVTSRGPVQTLRSNLISPQREREIHICTCIGHTSTLLTAGQPGSRVRWCRSRP